MSDTMKYALIAAGVLLLIRSRAPAAAPVTGGTIAAGDDFERPQWGANWISNQWAMVMQGTAASSGQIRPGGYL